MFFNNLLLLRTPRRHKPLKQYITVEYSAEHGTCEQCRIWHTVLARTAVWYGTGLRDGVRHDTVAAAASRAKTNSRCYKVVGSFYSSESSSTLTCCAAAVRCHKVHKRRHEHESTSTRARAPGGQSVRAVSRTPCAKSVGLFFNSVGLHAPGRLYVLGMSPRGCLRL